MYTPLNTIIPLFHSYVFNTPRDTEAPKQVWPNTYPLRRLFFNYRYGATDRTVMQARICYMAWPQCCAAHMISAPGVHSAEDYQRGYGQGGSEIQAKNVPHIEDFVMAGAPAKWSPDTARGFGYDMLAQALAAIVVGSGNTVFGTDNSHGKILKLITRLEQYQAAGGGAKPFCSSYVTDTTLQARTTETCKLVRRNNTAWGPWAESMAQGGLSSMGKLKIIKSRAFPHRPDMTMYSLRFTRTNCKNPSITPTLKTSEVLVKKLLSTAYTKTAPSSTWGHA